MAVSPRAENGLSQHYIALGDSLSTDTYAGGPGCGASSLLYRDNGVFPGFVGRDLRTLVPDLRFLNFAADGAVSAAISLGQAPFLADVPGDVRVVTLTAGRDDLLGIWGAELQTGEIMARDLAVMLDEILGEVRDAAGEDALILVGNVYDPTDGTGDFEALGVEEWEDGLLVLDLVNGTIEDAADDHDALLVDIHGHFLGHGLAADDPEHPGHDPSDPTGWYVQTVEPSDRGASEIRRAFWERVEEMFPDAARC
jgi:lysophospholipase L1-like esterase